MGKYNDFTDYNFQGADLSSANITGTNFRRANLKDAIVTNAKHENVDLSRATWKDGTECKDPSIGSCKHDGVSDYINDAKNSIDFL
jgi:hypothetical protein